MKHVPQLMLLHKSWLESDHCLTSILEDFHPRFRPRFHPNHPSHEQRAFTRICYAGWSLTIAWPASPQDFHPRFRPRFHPNHPSHERKASTISCYQMLTGSVLKEFHPRFHPRFHPNHPKRLPRPFFREQRFAETLFCKISILGFGLGSVLIILTGIRWKSHEKSIKKTDF